MEERTHYDPAASAEWAQSVGLFTPAARYAPAPVTTLYGAKLHVTVDDKHLHIWRTTASGNGTPVESIPLDDLRLCRRLE